MSDLSKRRGTPRKEVFEARPMDLDKEPVGNWQIVISGGVCTWKFDMATVVSCLEIRAMGRNETKLVPIPTWNFIHVLAGDSLRLHF